MSVVVGVDPGLRACGVAIVDARTGELTRASLVKARPDVEDADAWLAMGHAVGDHLADLCSGHTIEMLAVERQAIRMAGGGMSTKNPGQILELAHVVGVILGQVRATRYVSPYPQSWMGAKRPEGKTAGDLAWMALTMKEKERAPDGARKSDGHNVQEAIGIAKWAQRRWRLSFL